ncbi:MAG: hypothetical protein ACO1SV_09930 [Fimbriimonas sp.]
MNPNFARMLPVLAAGVSAVVVAQSSNFHFEDNAKKVVIDALDGRGAQTKTGFTMFLKGKVIARDTGEGLELRGDTVDATATGTAKKTDLTRAIATGAVRFTQRKGPKLTVIEGTRADYKAGGDPRVDMAGPVTLRNFVSATATTKREAMVATGSKGFAILERGTKAEGPSAIRRAELSGPVRIRLDSYEPDGKVSQLVATAGHMVIDEASKEPIITLTDRASVNGEGGSRVFRIQNMRRVVLKLNKDHQVTAIDTVRE